LVLNQFRVSKLHGLDEFFDSELSTICQQSGPVQTLDIVKFFTAGLTSDFHQNELFFAILPAPDQAFLYSFWEGEMDRRQRSKRENSPPQSEQGVSMRSQLGVFRHYRHQDYRYHGDTSDQSDYGQFA